MVYFVTPTYLKDTTPVNDNVEDKEIISLIRAAAEFKTKGYIGTYFFNDLLNKFNLQTLDAAETILVQEYMKPAIAWRAATETIVTTSYSIRNKGIQSQSGDFSASPEYKAIMFTYHHYSDKADYYDQQLIDFLKENREEYPAFMSDLNKDAKISKHGCNDPNAFGGGIMFI